MPQFHIWHETSIALSTCVQEVNSLDKALKNKISGLRNQYKRRRYFSLSSTLILIVSSLIYGTLLPEVPVAEGSTVELSHDAGNLDFNVDNHATLPLYMKYNDVQQSDAVGGWFDETFFFFDQSQLVDDIECRR